MRCFARSDRIIAGGRSRSLENPRGGVMGQARMIISRQIVIENVQHLVHLCGLDGMFLGELIFRPPSLPKSSHHV